ncbi:sugar kinase [Rhodoblastus sp.]|uniref:sugar kinase n=1 Tax=Rhodoblastus sp. TaxID=1962975 RepID=UPI003F99CE45
MVEFAPVGDDLYRRGFAGDTLNTCWHMAQLLGDRAEVGYLTRVGTDAFSSQFVDFITANGMDASTIERDPLRTIGLYVLSLAGVERSFSYWRETSAARRLADDVEALSALLNDCAMIHVSGITLGVIGEIGRRNLFHALAAARASGAVISFDPNVRLRLWTDVAELKTATREMFEITDIALPSFDDEALIWGDADPEATVTRVAALGVDEVVVKNGADDVSLQLGDKSWRAATPPKTDIRDTTGAGDSFNAGYLAARFIGTDPLAACAIAQGVAGEVIRCFGALAPVQTLAEYRDALRDPS